ncbi:MAG: transposase domain-containing protein [Clostridiales bacterium]|nr:transposase domain-containing protein [Clostridiales bacterium]
MSEYKASGKPAKANGLNVYLYLLYILTEMPKAKELNKSVIERCMLWSPSLPEWCHLK